ncbi:hypothetical protein [Desulfovibrio sp. SGI.169]|uniref:hypothetical protein n=1 Tax=Desulfovibrio sp. SGI.169 TaxID=3420561 RepID=UPI003D00E649
MSMKHLRLAVLFGLLAAGLFCLPPTRPAFASEVPEAAPEPLEPGSEDASFAFDCVLLGGFIKGHWVNAHDHQNNPLYYRYRIWGGHDWRVFSFNGSESMGIVCAIHGDHEGEFEGTEHEPPGLPIFDIQTPEGVLKFGSARLATNCAWNPAPRQATALPTDDAASLALVQGWLRQKALPAAEARIAQAFRVDLEGDGQTELLVCAQNILAPDSAEAAPAQATRGRYSVILLGKGTRDSGRAQALPLIHFLAPDDGKQAPRLHKLCHFADLNGDGILEIIVEERQGKGLRYAVYTPQGERVLSVPGHAAGKP